MNFGKRLAEIRKRKGFTQQQLSDLIGVHSSQLRNYESERSQPTLEIIRKLVTTLEVPSEELLFDPSERPDQNNDKDWLKQSEFLERLSPEDKQMLKSIAEGLILRRHINQLQPLTELAKSYEVIASLANQ